MEQLLAWHQARYPQMEALDVVKLVFQAMQGCGHLLGPEDVVARRIMQEESQLSPCADEPLYEPLGNRYVRLNLRAALARQLDPVWIARLMRLSADTPVASRSEVVSAIDALHNPDASVLARRLVDDPDWLPSHSETYRTLYAPAYRVIARRLLPVLDVLCRLKELPDTDRILICIDGPCGSGKSTLAGQLRTVLDAALVPMDDFFLPHPRKTSERLAQPGGNADWERVVSQFIEPWAQGQTAAYRPYKCHQMDYGETVTVTPSHYTILEGSYSLMPEIRKHAALSVFLTVSSEEQQKRIFRRDGPNMLQMFLTRWIPLEQKYHKALHLPDVDCLVLHSCPDQGM